MPVTLIARQGPAGHRLMDQVGKVLDPLAREHHGTDPRTLRPIIHRAWRKGFHAELPEPTLSVGARLPPVPPVLTSARIHGRVAAPSPLVVAQIRRVSPRFSFSTYRVDRIGRMAADPRPVTIVDFEPAPKCPDERYSNAVEAGEVVPPAELDYGEQARLRAAAWRAKTVYPGPVGEYVSGWLREWAECGLRSGRASFTQSVIDDVMSRQ
jgi:hypothetical protein